MARPTIEARRYSFFQSIISENPKWKKSIDYISNFNPDIFEVVTRKFEEYLLPTIALHIYKNKKNNSNEHVYDTLFCAPYKKIGENLLFKTNVYKRAMLNIEALIESYRITIEDIFNTLKALHIINDVDEICKIYFGLGDNHIEGRMSNKVDLVDGREYFLKPSPCIPDNIFYSVSSIIGADLIRRDFIGKWNQYSVFKYLKYQPFTKSPEKFYYEIGSLIALSCVLNLTDIHLENLLVHQGRPVILDFESMLVFYNNIGRTSSEQNTRVWSDVECTLFVQDNSYRSKDWHMISALQGGEVRNKSYLYPFAINDGTDNIYVKYRKLSNFVVTNRPKDDTGVIHPELYLEQIVNGFCQTMAKIGNYKHEISQAVRDHLSSNYYFRYIIRSTGYYQFIKVRSWQPSEMENEIVYWKLIEEKLNSTQTDTYSPQAVAEIVSCELSDLKNELIPFFYRDALSRNLYHASGKVILNVFSTSILDSWMEKFTAIDDEYIETNRAALVRCIQSTEHINLQKENEGWID